MNKTNSPFCIYLGQAGTGVANSIGASSLGILLSLGLPWFVMALIQKSNGETPYVILNNNGVEFTMLSLLLVILALYLCISLSGFTLHKLTGVALTLFYLLFISFAVVIELDILFDSGIIAC